MSAAIRTTPAPGEVPRAIATGPRSSISVNPIVRSRSCSAAAQVRHPRLAQLRHPRRAGVVRRLLFARPRLRRVAVVEHDLRAAELAMYSSVDQTAASVRYGTTPSQTKNAGGARVEPRPGKRVGRAPPARSRRLRTSTRPARRSRPPQSFRFHACVAGWSTSKTRTSVGYPPRHAYVSARHPARPPAARRPRSRVRAHPRRTATVPR